MSNKKNTNTDEKFEKQDFDLFAALDAIDRKDYQWWNKLSEEQQRKFVPWMMTHWLSAIKSNGPIGAYYLLSTDANVNKYLFNESIQNHPQLQWLMMCAASPGKGKQFHQWIPNLSERIGQLKVEATKTEVKKYFEKVYTDVSKSVIDEITEIFVNEQNHKHKLATIFPSMKLQDIEALSKIVTERDIKKYEEASGN